ncbi:Coenzyme PQQ synthesis protein A (modular protein) [Candidatus Methylacidithermus pantelleriae]|uniref:Coenzyme PQQ synthesis protein A n=1 Tax=Candidatus Methylacidithermus pantelleriae TaxID=2744239 RepID=A0A8J2FNR5_9BACT|nr:Coenzyme PQQ synthesis protein A (modular protein) [Candidatus Methylacidithermus pantelleriae]
MRRQKKLAPKTFSKYEKSSKQTFRKEASMAWERPDFEEVNLSMEVTTYVFVA